MESPVKNSNSEDTTFHRVIKEVQERAPTTSQLKTLLGWLIAGVVVLVFGSTAVIGTSIALSVVIPLVILFSPVLVPLGVVLFLAAAGTVSVVGSGLVAITSVSWLYNYWKGRDPPGADRVDAARDRIVGTAREIKEWASSYSNQMRAAPSA